MAGSIPSVLVRSRRCSRTPPRPHGSVNTNEKEDKERMTDHQQYAPGPASGAQVRKDGEKWTRILVRELLHPPAMVWQARLPTRRICANGRPLEADESLGTVGTVKLTTVGAPATHTLLDRLEDHLDGRAPADMFKRFADVRSLYG
jgi:hypothetical protein